MERLPQPRAPGAWGRWGRLVGRTESFCCPFPVLLGVSLGPRDCFLAQLAFVPLPLLGSVAGSDFRHSLLRQHIGEDERWPWGEMRCSRAPDPGFQVPRSRLPANQPVPQAALLVRPGERRARSSSAAWSGSSGSSSPRPQSPAPVPPGHCSLR